MALKCKHTNLDPNCVHCKRLKAVWDAKLETSGVENIEQADGNLKVWSSRKFRVDKGIMFFQAKEEYYRLAGQFLYEHKFEDATEKEIWTLWSEGLSRNKIVSKVKSRSPWKINNIITKLERIMLIQTGIRRS